MPQLACFMVENTYLNAESDPARRRHPDGAALSVDEQAACSKTLAVAAREAGRGDPGDRRGAASRSRPRATVAGHRGRPRRRADHPRARWRAAAPGVPVIAEEEVAAGRIPAHGDTYFLVDPLDGTKEFVRGGDDYTVNIGLIVGRHADAGRGLSRRRRGDAARRARRARARGSRTASGRRSIADARARREAGRGRVQVALHPGDRRLSRGRGRPAATMSHRLEPQILHRRGGSRRHLSAPVADQRMGHGRGPRGAARRGRAGRRARRRAAALWQDSLPQSGFVATAGWEAPAIGPFLEEFAGGGDLPQGV